MHEHDLLSPMLYRIHDPKLEEGCFEITGLNLSEKPDTDDPQVLRLIEAHKFNADNWGIFWPVNLFEGARKKENLKKLRAWFVECDGGDKKEMLRKFKDSLMPSLIVESKRGYHAYWYCDDTATMDQYRPIIEFRLIPFFDGDPNAKDLCRILRVPGYFHCKEPDKKFLVQTIHSDDSLHYSESDMLQAFPMKKKEEERFEEQKKFKMEFKDDGDLWEKIYDLDCEAALQRLSGSTAVNGERYSFKKSSKGSMNIFVDGKSTSCWIDASRRIGSTSKGGPTIWQWLRWYGHDHKTIYQHLKNVFPELFS